MQESQGRWFIMAFVDELLKHFSGRGVIPHRRYSPRASKHDPVKFRSRRYSPDRRELMFFGEFLQKNNYPIHRALTYVYLRGEKP